MAKTRTDGDNIATLNVSTINLRTLAAVSLFASRDETRYYLNGVCIELDERGATYVATDGHRLLAYRDVLTAEEKDNRLTGIFIVPAPHCKVYKLDKEEDGYAKVFGSDRRLTISHNLVDLSFSPIDGIFPDWRRVIPAGPASGVLAQFNLKYLAEVHKFSKQLGLGDPFIAPNGDGPAFIWFAARPHVIGIIMPIRTFDEADRIPAEWVRRGPPREQGDIEDELMTSDQERDVGDAQQAA